MAHTVDQAGMIKGFLVQNIVQIAADALFILPVGAIFHDILKHILHLQVSASMTGTFQGTDGRRDGRIGVCSGRSHHVGGERGVITAAVLGMEHQSRIQNLSFQFCVLSVFP